MQLGAHAAFDCRISQLPGTEVVVDYFSWRAEDAHRNALNAHCYWTLREEGQSAAQATSALIGMSVADKNELLFQRAGVNFNDLPLWHRRGVGVYWKTEEAEDQDAQTAAVRRVPRRSLFRDLELPMREVYREFVSSLLGS